MQPIDIASLSFLAKARICWGFFWRGIITTVASMVLGGLLGGLFGALLAFSGMAREIGQPTAQAGGALFGVVIGAVCFYIWVKWLLSARLGKFRLLLVHANGASD